MRDSVSSSGPDLAAGFTLFPTREAVSTLAGLRANFTALADRPVQRIQFGNEFCERLIPTKVQLEKALDRALADGLDLTLVTPMTTELDLPPLRELLAVLPGGNEVVVNDWGVARLLRNRFPDLVPVAGRLLCKMIKDPRLPSAQWKGHTPSGIRVPGFLRNLNRLGIDRVEIDVPPYATPEDFVLPGKHLSVHTPYGYAVRGRACRIGSLNRPAHKKFQCGEMCRRECLVYVTAMARPQQTDAEPATFQRGNTVFYRHTPEMTAPLLEAMENGAVDRIILSGDWNEARRTH